MILWYAKNLEIGIQWVATNQKEKARASVSSLVDTLRRPIFRHFANQGAIFLLIYSDTKWHFLYEGTLIKIPF